MIRQEPQVVLQRSTNLVSVIGLQEKTSGIYPIDADVKCTLLAGSGQAIDGATDIAMPYVVGTTGKNSLYRGILDSAVDYAGVAKARITITRAGAQREINCACVAREG